MGKINVVQAINQAAEEAAWVSSHPYAGLADERGTLERFPIDRILVEDPTLKLCPRAWLDAFLFEGGNVDAMGVYGISPWEREDRTPIWDIIPGYVAGRLFSEGEERRKLLKSREARDHYRWDALGSIYPIIKARKAGLDVQVSSDISLDDFVRLKTGCERYHLLHEAGGKLKPVMTLGHMSPESFNYHLAKTCTRRTWQVASLVTDLIGAYSNTGQIKDVEYARHQYKRFEGTFFGYLILCKIKAQKRIRAKILYQKRFWSLEERHKTKQFASKKALFWLIKTDRESPEFFRREYKKDGTVSIWCDGFRPGKGFPSSDQAELFGRINHMGYWDVFFRIKSVRNNPHVFSTYTSRENVYFTVLKNGKEVYWNSEGMEIPTRDVDSTLKGAVNGTTYYVWDKAEGFRSHVEGSSLKEARERFLSKKKRKGLILSLNDVRNDRTGTSAFCLAGVKNFLRRRMPHLARLIEPYSAWEQIPDEVMSIEWTLVSRDIFEGYSEP
jgi:hypothetical protein